MNEEMQKQWSEVKVRLRRARARLSLSCRRFNESCDMFLFFDEGKISRTSQKSYKVTMDEAKLELEVSLNWLNTTSADHDILAKMFNQEMNK